MKKYKSIVVFSGGMDSSLCLALAIQKFGKRHVLALTFNYDQRHRQELKQSQKIARYFQVDQQIITLDFLPAISHNALTRHHLKISKSKKKNSAPPNTMVVGRNGLFARIGAMVACEVRAESLWMGVMGLEAANSGYRDCSPQYIKLVEKVLRLDLGNSRFKIHTPLIKMTKFQTMKLGHKLGHLDFLWKNTISCYEGLPAEGCGRCPACLLRNEGWQQFQDA